MTTESASLSATRLLEQAADKVRYAVTAALSHVDGPQADRLDRLARVLDGEAAYADNRDRGLPIIRRRTDVPDDAALGWYLKYDATTRAERARLGLTNDYTAEPEIGTAA